MSEQTPDDEPTPAADSDATAAEGGSGRGGSLGTPSGLPEEEPPSRDQEENEAVSGGGVVSDPENDEPDPSKD